jgi:capsular polysaccharide transport system ATP-binding protein
MWGFVDCTRYYMTYGVPNVILHEASLVVQTHERLGLLVPQGGGKTTMLKMLAGVDQPNSGHVLRDKGGLPLGFGGAFLPERTGEQNIHELASLVGTDPFTYSAFCAEFAELGETYFTPMKLWTAALRNRLAFTASLGAPAATYLADGKIVGGDRPFVEKFLAALSERLQTTGLIFLASNPRATADLCDRHAVVVRGKIIACSSHLEATELFELNWKSLGGSEAVDEDMASFDLA